MIKVYKDGTSWGAFVGLDLQVGECEFDDAGPDEAAQKLLTRLKKEHPDRYKFTSDIAKEGENWHFCTGHGRDYSYIGKMPKGVW